MLLSVGKPMTKPITKLRRCAAVGCQKQFDPETDNQLYHNKRCKNREAQRRLRERARMNGKQR